MQNVALAPSPPRVGVLEVGVGDAAVARGRGVQRRGLAAEADRLSWAADEVAATLGISLGAGSDLVWLAVRLSTVMPAALTALGEARLDVARVRVLAEATTVLDEEIAARVADELVTGLDTPVWDGPSPRPPTRAGRPAGPGLG